MEILRGDIYNINVRIENAVCRLYILAN